MYTHAIVSSGSIRSPWISTRPNILFGFVFGSGYSILRRSFKIQPTDGVMMSCPLACIISIQQSPPVSIAVNALDYCSKAPCAVSFCRHYLKNVSSLVITKKCSPIGGIASVELYSTTTLGDGAKVGSLSLPRAATTKCPYQQCRIT
jgi:hypothetical protein